jgi:LacI family transcriptional regulator
MKKSRQVVVHLWMTGEYGRGILRGISQYMRKFPGWDLSVITQLGFEYTNPVLRRQPSGFIGHITSSVEVKVVHELNVPAVNVSGRLNPSNKVATVIADDWEVGRTAAHFFLDRGFRNFAFCGSSGNFSNDRRFKGFAGVVENAKCRCVAHNLTWPVDNSREMPQFHQSMKEWIRSQALPLALMCYNDLQAHQMKELCLSCGLRVPDDVAILGVDNDEIICSLSSPNLSSVELPLEQIGYRAAMMLEEMMDSKSILTERVLLPPVGVVPRQSTDILAVSDPDVAQALQFIHGNVEKALQVDDVVKHSSLTRRTLQRRFLQNLGKTIGQQIAIFRLQTAQHLLISSDIKISEVARRSGYESQAYLSKVFRKKTKMTPSEYRNQFRSE